MTVYNSSTDRRWFPEFGYRNRQTRGGTVKKAAWIAGIFILSILATTVVEAAEYQIVAHPSVGIDTISKRDLTRIFFKQRTRWASGAVAKPIDQTMKTEVRASFSEAVLNRSLSAVESYWNSQVFSGKNTPPPTAKSDAEVLDFVKSTSGAVGYVTSDAKTSGVHVVTVLD